MNLRTLIREVPDFPIPGVLFRDITPLLADPAGLAAAVDAMCRPWTGHGVDLVAAVEARGFLFGPALAIRLGAGFVPVRKAGKLPWRTRSVEYSLEYGTGVLSVHEDALMPGQRVLVADDLLATGGTAAAVVRLLGELGGEVRGLQFMVELAGLGGRGALAGHEVHSVITYP